MRPRAFQHRPDAAGDRDVVVLDQDRVIEPKAVIETAAAAHRIFLQRAQARRGLAGAADPHFGAGGVADIIGGQRRDAGEPADEIQRGTLARQHRARRARNRQHMHAGGDRAAVADMGLDADVRRQFLQDRDRQRQARDHAGLPRDHDRRGRGSPRGSWPIEVMSPARPRSSLRARCMASSMASGDRNASGCRSEAGVMIIVFLSGGHRLQRRALGQRRRDLARCGQRGHGALCEIGIFRRIIGAVMRAAAFAPRPCRCRDQQRRCRHVAERDIAGVALDRRE